MTVSDSLTPPTASEPAVAARGKTWSTTRWRRRELGIFLRSRRERLSPELHRMETGKRRRTKGLRREEVASLLGVSPSWYTKLEQGLDVSPSPRLLARIAQVLDLSGIEREQLMRLGMDEPENTPPLDEAALPSAQRIIDAMPWSPAFVLTSRADYVADNKAARALFGNFRTFPGDGNQLISLFLDEKTRAPLPVWLESARSQVAMFRTAFARYIHDPALQDLVTHLLQKSPEFRQLWNAYELPSASSRVMRYRLADGRELTFSHFTFFADLEKQLRVEVFNPAHSETQRIMADLVAELTEAGAAD